MRIREQARLELDRYEHKLATSVDLQKALDPIDENVKTLEKELLAAKVRI